MNIFFPNISKFQSAVKIDYATSVDDGKNINTTMRTASLSHISFYSLESPIKKILITAFVVSMIAIIVATILNQTNILGLEAAGAIVGAGISGAMFAIGWWGINKFSFMRKVDRLLKDQKPEDWKTGADYPGIKNMNKPIQDYRPKDKRDFSLNGNSIFVKRYSISTPTGDRFIIEFCKNRSIRDDRELIINAKT